MLQSSKQDSVGLNMQDKLSYGTAFTLLAIAKRMQFGSRLAKNNYERMLERLARRHPPTSTFTRAIPIPRETDISVEDYYERYVVPGKPVVLAGLCADWPAVQKWSKDYLLKEALALPNVDSEEDAQKWLQTPHHMLTEIPHLGKDLKPAILRKYARLGNSNPFTVKLFSGAANIRTRLHMDVGTNFLVHLHGTKRFTMFHREDTPFVYSNVALSPTEYSYYSDCMGLEGTVAEQLERWPLLKHATRLEITLEPGDALYIPPFCWHLPHYDTFCLSAACWWHESPISYIKEAPLIGLLASPAYLNAFKYNRKLRHDYPYSEYVPLEYSQPMS